MSLMRSVTLVVSWASTVSPSTIRTTRAVSPPLGIVGESAVGVGPRRAVVEGAPVVVVEVGDGIDVVVARSPVVDVTAVVDVVDGLASGMLLAVGLSPEINPMPITRTTKVRIASGT